MLYIVKILYYWKEGIEKGCIIQKQYPFKYIIEPLLAEKNTLISITMIG